MTPAYLYYSTVVVISLSTACALFSNWFFAIWVVVILLLINVSASLCDSYEDDE